MRLFRSAFLIIGLIVLLLNPSFGHGQTCTISNAGTSSTCRKFTILLLPRFAYVVNRGSNSVSMYTIDASTGALTSIGTISAGMNPLSVAVDPSGRFAYVANAGAAAPWSIPGGVSMYTIDASTGALTSVGTAPAGGNPGSVAVHPSGRFVYLANGNPNVISMYTIDASTGTLTSVGTAPAGGNPTSLAVHPSGKFAYLANVNPNVISMYTIDSSTGSLTSIGTIATPYGARSVVVEPSGKFAYAALWDPGKVARYAINATTGALTFAGTLGAGNAPYSMAVHPSGKFAYVANQLSGDVSMYSLDASTGALTSLGTIAAGRYPYSVAVDPSGRFAYVANGGSNNVSMYMIDATSGALTSAGTITAGMAPSSVATTGTTVPVLSSNGVVNGANFQGGTAVAPGSIAAVFGSNLAWMTESATGTPLPSTLGGAALLFNGNIRVPLFYTSTRQINIQVPWELAGQTQAPLTDTVAGLTSSPAAINLAAFSPGIFAINSQGTGQGAIQIANTTIFAAPEGSVPGALARPARKGEFLIIYCTGLGDVNNRPASGATALEDALSTTKAIPTVTIGGQTARANFSGLTPGFVGLYQVNVQVPDDAPTGSAVQVVLSIGGSTSNAVTIAVQ